MRTKVTFSVALSRKGFPYLHPQLTLTVNGPTNARELEALAFEYAAKAARATPLGERWFIAARSDGKGEALVDLELAKGDERETVAAIAVLRQIAE